MTRKTKIVDGKRAKNALRLTGKNLQATRQYNYQPSLATANKIQFSGSLKAGFETKPFKRTFKNSAANKIASPGKGWKRVDDGWLSKNGREFRSHWMNFDGPKKRTFKPQIPQRTKKTFPNVKKKLPLEAGWVSFKGAVKSHPDHPHFCDACDF